MDAKDLRTETALGERNNDGSKYSQSGGTALHCDRNKPYQDIGSNSLAKVDVQNIRPCAVIGPDRIVPQPASSESYIKKAQSEPWSCIDNAYHNRLPPEYPHKLVNFQNPARNISPRQTFQENMQRIMVPPSYNSVDAANYTQVSERNNALHKNIKINVPPEAKFCDVPYTVYPKNSNDPKSVRIPDVCLNTAKPTATRTAPHGWPPSSVNIHSTRTYGAPEIYPYQDYSNCTGPRPILPRSNRNVPDDSTYVYSEPFYHQEGNMRFKPYPPVKERLSHPRYDYINYANTFHPPPAFHSHKYELHKPVPPHPYPPYPSIKYLDRPPETIMDYQRNQQGTYNIPYHNQAMNPNYAAVLGNTSQHKMHLYPPDGHNKSLPPNKHDYESGCPKLYSPSDNYLVNEMGRMQSMKSQVIMPNYPALNMHNIPVNTYYKKDNHLNGYEYLPPHIRSVDPSLNIHNSIIRHGPVYPSSTIAISPTDSSGSTDVTHMIGNPQEDCGYVSQSSTASIRSMDSGINRIPNEYLRKYYDSRYGPIIRTPVMTKNELNSNSSTKEKKNLNLRQFLQMWNEGDEETDDNNPKEIVIQSGLKNDKFNKGCEVINQPNQEQLYVLGLVNVPSEELSKYEHIQKVSKLPENIKGYNHIELLNQFEEAIESSNMSNYKSPTPKDYQIPFKGVPVRQTVSSIPPRPLSPLDVEAKISQSIIHKEVGCNFEIKPCSPKMLNVEVATPVQNILAERAIEKVANPVMLKSPRLNSIEDNIDCKINRIDNTLNINNEPVRIPSCKMVNTHFSNHNTMDSIKNSYSLHDLESNSGLCLASLPRLDNDIELNFPEVNQQFIDANKRDSMSLTASIRDLPMLEELDQSKNQTQNNDIDMHVLSPKRDVKNSPCVVDSEKEGREVSKLSKYRKSKTYSSDSKENLNATRTDSVIIKNPENLKNYEENNLSPNNVKQIKDINLISHENIADDLDKTPIMQPHEDKEKGMSIDMAIDFSLSKANSNDNLESKTIESVPKDITEQNDSILDDHLTKIPFLYCDQNDISIPVGNIGNIKEKVSTIKNTAQEDINEETEYLPPVSVADISFEKPIGRKCCMSPESDTNNITTTTLLPIDFIAASESLQTYENDDENKNHKLDIQNVTQLNEVTPSNIVEIYNKSCSGSGNTKEVADLVFHKSDHSNLNHSENTIEDLENTKCSDIILTDNLNDTGKTTIFDDALNINSCDSKLICVNHQIENIIDIKDPQNINCCDLEAKDDLNGTDNTAVMEKNPNLNCSNLKLSNDSNRTEHTKNVEDPHISIRKSNHQSIDCSELKSPYDLNYSEQIQESQHMSSPDLELTDKEIVDNQVSISNIIAIASKDEITVQSQNDVSVGDENRKDSEYECNLDVLSDKKPGIYSSSINSKSEGTMEIDDTNNGCVSGNNTAMSSPDTSETDNQKDFVLHSPKDIHKLEGFMEIVDSNNESSCSIMAMSSPVASGMDHQNSFILHSPKDSSVAVEKIFSPHKMDTQELEDCHSMTTTKKNLSKYDLSSPVHNSNNNAQLNKIESNVHHSSLNEFTSTSNDYDSSLTTNQDTINDITSTNTENKITSPSQGYVSDRELLCTKSEHRLEVSCTENKLNSSCSLISVVKEEERSYIKRGYLSLGSKEMYSPQIQNLLVFCEGIVSTENFLRNDSTALTNKRTIQDIEIPTESDIKDKDNQTNHETDSINEFVSPTTELSSLIVLKDSSETDNNDLNENSKINTTDGKLKNTNIFNNQNQPSAENVSYKVEDTVSMLMNSTSNLVTNGTSNIINYCEQKSTPELREEISEPNSSSELNEVSSRLSNYQALINHEKQNVHETETVHTVSDDVTHELDIQINFFDEELTCRDRPSNYNSDVLKANDITFKCHNMSRQTDFGGNISDSLEKQLDSEPGTTQTETILKQAEELHVESQCHKENNKLKELLNKQLQFIDKDEIKDSISTTQEIRYSEVSKHRNDCNEISEQEDKHSNLDDDISENIDNLSNYHEEIVEELIRQQNYIEEISSGLDEKSICNSEEPDYMDNQSISCEETNDKNHVYTNNSNGTPECPNEQSNKPKLCPDLTFKPLKKQYDCIDEELNSTNAEGASSYNNNPTEHNMENRKRQHLKRSLSDSALNIYKNNENPAIDNEEHIPFMWPYKRKKTDNVDNHLLAQNLCNIIQSNRRNSVSTFYNEDNVSFCILIDNSCIIAEENNEHEKICYTELPEGCLAEMQEDCENREDNIETMSEALTNSQQENNGDHSDAYLMQNEDKLTESWVEDVGCVETVIGDDIAENVEISGPSSPKEDATSDIDESDNVFSSSDHANKVKFIYGEKMCNDDAHFVQILYNTPQMDVNKTLGRRESMVSTEYYDNNSLEKVLSESSVKMSPYVPRYVEPMISPVIMNQQETKVKTIETISTYQKPTICVDVVEEMDLKNRTSNPISNDQNDIVDSCESSIDNVFTDNENTESNYVTSSSPEVSSTTSEDKNSGILLKITNYKGSRVSQVNDISRDKMRPSCKFTEDKDYIQSHVNFPTHRPLITKGAQKYIPPLKESVGDLKVKLSLPPHSLMKLKQLKKSKEQPKVNKQNNSVPRTLKKPKPKFEDVLMSIDEIHFKMHKDKSKKSKKSVPKVVIKKNENGSHYASTSNRVDFNPDLTGRKWQPWVFIEKNNFIDKMAIKRKIKAVYSHRKRTYVLAEKFQKYKAVNDAKFVITPPVTDCPATGLKYTIRLKHN